MPRKESRQVETLSYVMFIAKTKSYNEDITLGDGSVIKAGTPVTIAWMSFTVDGRNNLVAGFADDDEMLAMMDKVQLVKRISKSGKPRVETRFPVKVVYLDTDDPEIKEVLDLIELSSQSLHARTKTSSKQIIGNAEEREVEELVAKFREMGFTKSAQISNYIRKHRLGFQFPNITGVLELKRGDGDCVDTWKFNGGIAPRFYREICNRLGLGNNGSNAEVSGFESYRERGTCDL